MNTQTIILCFLLFFVLAACSPNEQSEETNEREEMREDLKEECEAEGGEVIGCETITGLACSKPTTDAGKPCTSSDECESSCIAPEDCPDGKTNITGTCGERTALSCQGVRTVYNGQCQALMAT